MPLRWGFLFVKQSSRIFNYQIPVPQFPKGSA